MVVVVVVTTITMEVIITTMEAQGLVDQDIMVHDIITVDLFVLVLGDLVNTESNTFFFFFDFFVVYFQKQSN